MKTTLVWRNAPLPTHRRPATPGEMLRYEFMEPMNLTQQALAHALEIDRRALSAILNHRRKMTLKIALRLERVLGVSARFWIDVQEALDFWDAMHDSETRRGLKRLKRLTVVS
jgi:antitoxin HigA-1